MHAMELFTSFEGLRQAGWTGEADTQARYGYISGISIISSQGLHRLWMFGDTRQAMGLHLRSTSHGGHGYLRGGGSVTSVPLTHHSALWLAGLSGGIPYHIMPPTHIHSSIALLSYSTSPILISHLYWS